MDILFIALFMFVLGTVILISYLMLNDINDSFQDQEGMSAKGKEIISDSESRFTSNFDAIFGFVFIGISIAVIISAFMIDTNPVFMIISLILVIFFIIVAALMSNAYYEVESNSAFSDFAEDFRLMHFFMNNLAYYVLIEGVLVMIALYTRTGGGVV
jgi:F0F1-type ATP synthase assembly protein I